MRSLSLLSPLDCADGQAHAKHSQQSVVGTSDSIMVGYDYDAGKSCAWHPQLVDLLVERGAEKVESGGKAKL